MGYYMAGRGDFYRGFRGDPGFFGFLGGLAKKAVGFIPGVGPIAEQIVSKIAPEGGAVRKVASTAIEVAKKHPALTALGTVGAGTGAVGAAHMVARGAPSGAGMGAGTMGGRARGGGNGKRRRMKVTNVKALRRALRRAYGFERLAMKVIRLTNPRRKGRFGGFKQRKRKKV